MTGWSGMPSRRDAGFAAGTFVIGCVLYALDATLFPGSTVDPLAARLTLLAIICLAQLVASRLPLSCLAVGLGVIAADGVLGPTLSVLIAFGELLYAAARYGDQRVARLVLPTLAGATVVAAVWVGMATRDAAAVVLVPLLSAGLFLSPVLWARDVRRQEELARLERLRADELTRLAAGDRHAAVVAERARLARDLHDVIASHLSAIALQSTAGLSNDDRDIARRALSSIRQNSVDALTEMRAMIGLLRDHEAAETPVRAPARLADIGTVVEAARNSGVDLRVDVGQVDGLPAAVDLTAYRVLQEAITNVTRHAPGSSGTVIVRPEDGELILEVLNDCPGDAPADPHGNGVGIDNMRDRTVSVGGKFAAGRRGDRWRVHARIPLTGAPL